MLAAMAVGQGTSTTMNDRVTVIGKIRRSVRDWGVRDTAGFLLSKAATRLLAPAFRKRDVPSLVAMWEFAGFAAAEPDAVLIRLLGIDAPTLARLHAEHDDLTEAIARRSTERALNYPRSWALGAGSSFVLYALVRTLAPATVLETGVANGHSSVVILRALEANGRPATLHSVDIASNVGTLIDVDEKARWRYHLLPPGAPKRAFRDIVAQLPPLDLMIHDSDHSYRWIDFELETVLPKMSPTGLLVCDDADSCYAAIDFCARHAIEPLLLVDTIKVLALLPLRAYVQKP